MADPRASRLGVAVAALLAGVFALSLGLVLLRFAPPAPVDAETAGNGFSATRAIERLGRVLGDGRPHPVGTLANRAVRERIVAELTTLGYEPRVQRRFMCARGLCAEVQNVIATIGAGDDVLMVNAHYDSVAAGPGAGDDGAGVATVLELARVLKQRAPPTNTILLLLNDGEEAGLLGAKAFMRHDVLAPRVRVAINIEARGSGGPSLMFETSGPTAPLAELLTRLPRPATGSLFSAIYERLPNDTDLTVFRREGVVGFNFGFIDNVAHYHTSADNLENLEPGSVQHNGDNVLGLVEALSDGDLTALDQGDDAVWFDVLSVVLIRWPASWSLPLALLAIGLLLLAVVAGKQPRRFGGIAAFFMLALLSVVLSVVLGWGLMELVGTHQGMRGRSTNLALPVIVLAAAAAGVVAQLGVLMPTVPPRARFAGVWLLWGVLGVVMANLMNPGSYLFIAPTLVAGIVAVATVGVDDDSWVARVACVVPSVPAAIMWLHVWVAMMSAVDLQWNPVFTLCFALAFSTALPALHGLPRRKPGLVGAAVALGALVACWQIPAYDTSSPQRMSIVHHQGSGDGDAEWWIDASWGPLPKPLSDVARIHRYGQPPLPWVGYGTTAFGVAPRIDVRSPILSKLSSAQNAARYRLSTQRGAAVVGLIIPVGGSIAGVEIEGQSVRPAQLRTARWPNHRLFGCVCPGPVEVTVHHRAQDAIAESVELFDIVLDIPDVASNMKTARGRAAVPSQDGDLSIVTTQLELR